METIPWPSGVSVQMVGHAALLIEYGGTGLLCDPWLAGRVFNDSWALTTPSLPLEAVIDRTTHLWISHEHPDHLHWPSLRRIAAAGGHRIALAFQRHWTTDVAAHLGTLGFGPVRELHPFRWTRLGPGFEVASIPAGRIDCGLAIRAGGALILDLNDCKLGPRYSKALARRFPQPDLLCCQYSPASWQPRAADRSQAGDKLLKRAAGYGAAFRSRALLLFASHAYFCHRENRWMNDHIACPVAAVERVSALSGCPTGMLYPGERWTSATGFRDARDSARRYRADLDRAMARPPVDTPLVDFARLLAVAREHMTLVEAACPVRKRRALPPLRIHVTDLDRRLTFFVATGEVRLDRPGDCDIAVGSQALDYACTHRWGFDTLDISARYEVLRGSKDHPVLRLFQDLSADPHRAGHWTSYLTGRALRYFWARRWDLADIRAKRRREAKAFREAMAIRAFPDRALPTIEGN